MMDLMLPGRDSGPDDYEAQSALRTLLEAEKLQTSGDDDLFARICEQIEHNQDLLTRVYTLVEGLKGQDVDTDVDDLLTRMDRVFKPRKGAVYG
jgi:hypothetical protein